MGYYTIRLDPDASKICTIIFRGRWYKTPTKEGTDHPRIDTPQNVKQLCRFLGMVQYYRDIWARCSETLATLTNLVGECGHTKPWHWNKIHQQAYDTVKATIVCDVTLAYPDYSQGFEIYTDSSTFQLDAVINQTNRPLEFFSRN
eukprot:CCRYP_015300-RA/>CCRYP_015300-RA protein AED:0.53 eAED:0.58 QI:0/0/0/0.66/0/0/3/0/144